MSRDQRPGRQKVVAAGAARTAPTGSEAPASDMAVGAVATVGSTAGASSANSPSRLLLAALFLVGAAIGGVALIMIERLLAARP